MSADFIETARLCEHIYKLAYPPLMYKRNASGKSILNFCTHYCSLPVRLTGCDLTAISYPVDNSQLNGGSVVESQASLNNRILIFRLNSN
jgi:hypothetical protein